MEGGRERGKEGGAEGGRGRGRGGEREGESARSMTMRTMVLCGLGDVGSDIPGIVRRCRAEYHPLPHK